MAYTLAWSETFPPDTQPANLLGDDVRAFKRDVRERIASFGAGTLANRPTPEASFAGVTYFATDTGQYFRWNGTSWDAIASRIIGIPFIIDGGGSAITTGQKGHLEIPFACTITGWTILADQSGSIVVDVWKDTYANFPPTVADTIAGSEKPTLSTAQKNQDLTLSTWTTAVAAGDILAFNVDSITTCTRVLVSIRATIP